MPPRKYRRPKTAVKPKSKPVYKSKKRKLRKSTNRLAGPFLAYNQMDPFKPYHNCKLSFTHSFALTTGTSNTLFGAENVYRLNSLYDPDLTGGSGIQPYGYDVLSQIYRNYKVNAVLIQIVISDPTSDGTVFGAQLQPPNEPFTFPSVSVDRAREQPMSIVRSINNSGKQVVTIKQYVPMHILLGISKLQFMSDTDIYAAATTANPVAQPFLRVALANERSVTSTALIRVTLTYYTRFYDRVVLPRSL